MTWRTEAACRGKDPDYWHPPQDQPWLVYKAIKICAKCPVKQQCLEFALTFTPTEDQYGIYGGYNPKQRNQIRLGETPRPMNTKRQVITGLDDV